jgi:hypothetical protein
MSFSKSWVLAWVPLNGSKTCLPQACLIISSRQVGGSVPHHRHDASRDNCTFSAVEQCPVPSSTSSLTSSSHHIIFHFSLILLTRNQNLLPNSVSFQNPPNIHIQNTHHPSVLRKLKEDAGQEDYDLGLQLLSLDGILTAGTNDASIVTIGSPEWQLRESHSLKRPQNRRRGIRVKAA